MTDDSQPEATASRPTPLSMMSFPTRRTGRPTPFFVSDRTAPRRRRPADAVRLGGMLLIFGLLWWAASNPRPIDERVLELFIDLPNWMRTLAWFGFSASAVAAAVLATIGLVYARRGRGLARDLLTALALSVGVGLIAGRMVEGSWPPVAPEFLGVERYPAFPAIRVVFVVTIGMVLAPYVNVQIRRLLKWSSLISIVSSVLLGLTTATTLLGGLVLSVAAVAAVRLAFGSPEGLPSIGRLTDTLFSVGIPVTDVRYRDQQPGTVGLATGISDEFGGVDIKIYGVDAANQQRAERVWRALWFKTAGPAPGAGRIEQAEHEALALLAASASNVSVPKIVGAGRTPDGDALVVSTGANGRTLAESDNIDDETLRAVWSELGALHRSARLSHGGLGPTSVRVLDEGVEFVDFANASMFPTEQQLAVDMASMLVTLALEAGIERTLDAAIDTVSADDLALCLPYIQNAVLDPTVRDRMRHAGLKTKELHAALAERLDVEAPPLASIRRVKTRDLLIAVAAIIAANALISQVSDVGLDTLSAEIQGASVGWLVVTFLIRMGSYTTAYIGMRALIGPTLPLLPTTLLQSAKGFVGLVVPSMVGRVGMDIRFLQNLGVPLAMATTQGPIISLIGFLAEVFLLIVCAWSIGQQVETDGLFDIDGGGLILIAAGVVVVGAIVVLSVGALRSKVLPVARDAWLAIKSIVSSPKTLGAIFGGEVLDRLLGAVALGATVAAFGASIPFAALVFVSVGTGLLAGIAPVPGGIGVAEATMTGLLVSVGLPSEQAVAIAITYRMITAYLPPVIGFFSLRWLTTEGYL